MTGKKKIGITHEVLTETHLSDFAEFAVQLLIKKANLIELWTNHD